MADPTLVQVTSGTSTSATPSATFTSTGNGNLLVLIVAADAYKSGDPSGWTLPTGGAQQTFFGHYLWYKTSTGGETSAGYTLGVATNSAWIFLEYNNTALSPYDTSDGQFTSSSSNAYTTPAVTPSVGRRLAIATMAGSKAAPSAMSQSTWLNGFTEQADIVTPNVSGTIDNVSAADLLLDGNGSTAYSSGSSYVPDPEARSGIIAVFKAMSSTWVYGSFARIGG